MLRQRAAQYIFLDDNLWIARALVCGFITAILLESVFYSQGECEDAKAARREYDHQVSNQMCCSTEWIISITGFTITGILALMGVRTIYEANHLGLMRCCCSEKEYRIQKALSISIGLEGFGLIILSVFQMCWQIEMHAIGAFFFFLPGCIHIGILFFSIDHIARDSVLTYIVEFSPCFLSFVAGVLRIFTGNYYAEWTLIAAIGAALLVTQIRLLRYDDERNVISVSTSSPTKGEEDL